MSKPLVRWTIGKSKQKSSYKILDVSIRQMISLYSDRFDYCVLYNHIEEKDILFLKEKYPNVVFTKQNWKLFPVNLSRPSDVGVGEHNQIINGSFWKICPPRLNPVGHEIFLDNDLVFLKRPKAIEDFLSSKDKNLIIRDSNVYLGKYQGLFENEKQGYNSGVIGLRPNYNFENHIVENSGFLDDVNDYGDEQGLLMYVLYKTNPIIGSSESFVGIHPDKLFLNGISDSRYEHLKKEDLDKKKFLQFYLDEKTGSWKNFNDFQSFESEMNITAPFGKLISKEETLRILRETFSNADVVHFLKSNRLSHFPWNYFRFKFI